MDRISPESLGLDCPLPADVFVLRQLLQRLESTAEVIGINEVG